MDTVYPEPTSMLYRRPVRKKLRGTAARYRTQPVTFAEIQEVDEENLEDIPEVTKATKKSTQSDLDLNRKFDEFRRLRDARNNKAETENSSPVENSPVMSPTKNPTAGKNHPLDTVENQNVSRVPGGLATPGIILQRPSL